MEINAIKTTEKIQKSSFLVQSISNEVKKLIVGQEQVIEFITVALLCNGHILLEGVPGVAKTTIIKAITHALGLSFKRIQFTPDLLPSDLVGTLIYNQKTNDFETKKGPIFANLILADEINRAPAKVQAALLEAMQERQVTIGSSTFILDKPFLVFATQNPIEQAGTYQLPESQLDRFMFKIIVDYPTVSEERQILHRTLDESIVNPVLTKKQLFEAQNLVQHVYIDEKIIEYILTIIFTTRTPELYGAARLKPYIQYGASPRATLALKYASSAHAFLHGRNFVIPDDVKKVAFVILGHRISLTYQAEAEELTSKQIVNDILSIVPSP